MKQDFKRLQAKKRKLERMETAKQEAMDALGDIRDQFVVAVPLKAPKDFKPLS